MKLEKLGRSGLPNFAARKRCHRMQSMCLQFVSGKQLRDNDAVARAINREGNNVNAAEGMQINSDEFIRVPLRALVSCVLAAVSVYQELRASPPAQFRNCAPPAALPFLCPGPFFASASFESLWVAKPPAKY